MHSMYLAGVPLPWSMLRQPIHFRARAPSRSGCQRHHPRSRCRWCECHGRNHRMGRANRFRRIAAAGMDRVVPVVIVIGVLPVPATVVRLERVMRPANASIGAGNNDVLAR